MKLNGSQLVSIAILAGIGGWMFTGELIRGGVVNSDAKSIAEREEARTAKAFPVRVITLQPTERQSVLEIRGRTKAGATVTVRAETGGTVQERSVEKGQLVAKDDLLCVLDRGIRGTNLAQAQAQLNQAQADFASNDRLRKQGFVTRSRMRQLQAALDTAKAALAAAQQDITRTEVRATADGMVQEPLAEVGDNLSPGGVCATLIQADPMLFTGQVSEQSISAIEIGMASDVKVVSGETVRGKVRYLSPVADANTRTFAIEIEIPNADRKIRDGLTAAAIIPLEATSAYQVEPSWLTLADDGKVGVRAVSEDSTVAFHPVKILTQGVDTMWVSGLQPGLQVITLGQNFVVQGAKVTAVTPAEMEALQKARLADDGATPVGVTPDEIENTATPKDTTPEVKS